ncbi:MAG: hypothetical protein V2A73_14455 [Pseudomonadota bacterium]
MARVRVIKRTDGIIQVQHRGDERYDGATLPRGTTPGDVADQVLVNPADLAGVTDTQVQMDIQDGVLVKHLDRRPAWEDAAESQAQDAVVLAELDADAGVPATTKKYLVALRDLCGKAACAAHGAPAEGRK